MANLDEIAKDITDIKVNVAGISGKMDSFTEFRDRQEKHNDNFYSMHAEHSRRLNRIWGAVAGLPVIGTILGWIVKSKS